MVALGTRGGVFAEGTPVWELRDCVAAHRLLEGQLADAEAAASKRISTPVFAAYAGHAHKESFCPAFVPGKCSSMTPLIHSCVFTHIQQSVR